MNNHVKNQHYVPKFLLKNFASRDKSFIWTFDKSEKFSVQSPIKERAIKSVASEDFFYDQIENNKESSFEYELQKIEDIAAPIIAKIIKTQTINKLLVEEKKILSQFVILQNLRTKKELILLEDSIFNLTKQIEFKANVKVPEIEHKKIWFSLLQQSLQFSEIIMKKVWMLCESHQSFIISDNPVTLQNTTDVSSTRGTLGLDSYGIEIYLPISPTLTLCFFCEKSLFNDYNYNKNFLPNIICESQNVENLNYLQIVSAERFIFSHKNEFDFVKLILKL